MRVVIDTNVLISYLLKPDADSAVTRLMRYAVTGAFELITPVAVRDELVRNVHSKPYLSERIERTALNELVQLLNVSDDTTAVESKLAAPAVRDLDDALILVAAIGADADVLVSGDDDLLVLSQYLDRPRILDPAEFLAELEAWGNSDT